MDRLTQLEDRLTGVMTTRVVTPVKTHGPPGPRVPSWWRGDEDASQSAILATRQISR